MRELEIKLTGTETLGDTMVCIDDKPIKIGKKNEFGSIVARYQTENDKVNIKVYKMLDSGGVLWFITQLFFFIISIFGILDVRRRDKCMYIDFETEVDLAEENKITLQINSPKEDAPAVGVETGLVTREVANKYVLDEQAKKTRKWLIVAKIILAVAVVVAAIVLLMIKL